MEKKEMPKVAVVEEYPSLAIAPRGSASKSFMPMPIENSIMPAESRCIVIFVFSRNWGIKAVCKAIGPERTMGKKAKLAAYSRGEHRVSPVVSRCVSTRYAI